ncbi:MAG TPA: efflux RND transporter periplasmic adaptor subunit [Bacillota bacterium]|nr:efflux RND transporter periplasmic adaptor subunit [Bacillota bacterium]
MKKRLTIIITCVVIFIILVIGYRANRQYLTHYPRVQAAMAERGDLIEDIEVSGKILGEDVRDIYADINGKIDRVYVDEGDYVKVGQPIMSFDANDIRLQLAQCQAEIIRLTQEDERLREQGVTPEIIAAEGKIAQEKIVLGQAERDYQRKQSLYKDDVISKNELDRSEDDYQAAKQRFDQAQKELQLAKANKISRSLETNQANLKVLRLQEQYLRKAIRDLTVLSPISGRISEIFPKAGERTRPEDRLGQVIDEKNIKVEAEVPAEDAPKVRNGDPAEVSFGTIADPYKAIVTEQLPPVKNMDNTYGNARIRLRVTNKNVTLIPGTTVCVRIRIGRAKLAVIVPIEAVHEERRTVRGDQEYFSVRPGTGENRKYVYVLKDCSETLDSTQEKERRWMIRDNIYQARKVYIKTGVSNVDRVEVLSGLDPFSQVIIYGDREINDYDRVIVVSRDERYKKPM